MERRLKKYLADQKKKLAETKEKDSESGSSSENDDSSSSSSASPASKRKKSMETSLLNSMKEIDTPLDCQRCEELERELNSVKMELSCVKKENTALLEKNLLLQDVKNRFTFSTIYIKPKFFFLGLPAMLRGLGTGSPSSAPGSPARTAAIASWNKRQRTMSGCSNDELPSSPSLVRENTSTPSKKVNIFLITLETHPKLCAKFQSRTVSLSAPLPEASWEPTAVTLKFLNVFFSSKFNF